MNKITQDGILENTNIFVYQILEWLASGKSQETIISEYPDISKEDISNALYYAAEKLKSPTELFIYVDGASSGNPGPAGIGVAIYNKNKDLIDKISQSIGETTNNVAEYRAVISALEYALDRKIKKITIFSDSELVVKQLNGEYLIKNKALKTLVFKIAKLIDKFTQVEIISISREENKLANKLATRATKGVKIG